MKIDWLACVFYFCALCMIVMLVLTPFVLYT